MNVGLQARTAPATTPAINPWRRAANQVSTPTAAAPQAIGSNRIVAAPAEPVATRTSCSTNENMGWLLKMACSRKAAHGGPGRMNSPTVSALSKSSDRPSPGR